MDELIRDQVMVAWVELGEGMCGEYNEEDKDDIELLRFDVLKLNNGEWEDPGDASYCTRFPASATPEQRRRGLEILMNAFYEPLMNGNSVKKIGERMSWIGLDWLVFDVEKSEYDFT